MRWRGMLQSLKIRNLALLEEVSLEFESGFTVVTGETGAGKSILLGALSLLAGERADKTLIRQGAGACEVEAALFFKEVTRINALLEELDLPVCEEGLLVLKRSLSRDKAPRLSVNGGLATLAALQQLGETWIDFHGPSEPRRLLKEGCQLELLDLFGQSGAALAAYQKAYAEWRGKLGERAKLSGETRLSDDQMAFLQNQLSRMDALELNEEAIEGLERDFQRLSQAEELIEITAQLARGLAGEEGATSQVAGLVREARRLESLDPAGKALADRLLAVSIELDDVGAECETLAGQFHFDPEEAEQIRARMDTWQDLRRRHGRDLVAVLAAREEMRRRLEVQGDIEGALMKLDREVKAAETAARKAATGLRTLREKAAKELTKVGAKAIGQLGFKKAEFVARITGLGELGPQGDCGVEFLFSPNVGEAPLPLNRIASSGELARVMLALKTVLADLDGVPVLVFDEVDANVGGEIGRVVGEKMASIAKTHQVFCVTHLPQVAAQGTAHLVVEKDQSRDRAVVTIEPIHERRKERVSELARMLGDRNAKSARAHAEELLG